ncbi:hypothetical protein C8N40_110143 [Pontibacter mucosus]|uniref:Uncharacterized protein n=1 Tax=Pontibacter mucosus TaxID=1649266 RepID=A0A2T5YDU0_9BACT|nr:hypothetical protein C8N40_110143 [Pontibacter mucosus]
MRPPAAIATAVREKHKALLAPLSTALPATRTLPLHYPHHFLPPCQLSCRVAPSGKQRTPASGEPRAALPGARSKPAGAGGPRGSFPGRQATPLPPVKASGAVFSGREARSKPAGKEQDETGLASGSILPCGAKGLQPSAQRGYRERACRGTYRTAINRQITN